MNEKLIDFCNYIQPIINSCVGFIKTEGYVTHIPGRILAMSGDEHVFASIKIPVVYDIYMTSMINRFLQLKTPEEQSNMFEEIYFTGWNIKANNLYRYDSLYNGISQNANPVFEEPDVYNIPNFDVMSSMTSIGNVRVSDGNNIYIIPASKSITPLNKSDTASLKIFNCAFNPINNNIKTIEYELYKKKFKLFVDIFMNILVV